MCKRVFANQTSEIGEVPFYKIGTIGAEADAFISQELYEEYRSKYNYPRHGEVLITCAGTVGKTITYKGEDAYYQDSNIVWISNPKQYYVNSFLQRVLSRIDWSKLNTTTIVRIYNDNLRDIVVFYPSKKEQDKITNLFSLIDDRIQTQIGAINKHESLIKAIAGELTCEGEKVRLADLVDCHSSTMQENDITNDGPYPVYGATGICGYTDSPMCKEDAIIIVKDGSGVGNIKFVSGGFSILGTLCYLTAKQDVSIGYVYCCLVNFDFSPYKTGMAIPHIYFKDYGKGEINIKNAAEQQKTRTLVLSLMNKLDVERQLLKQYKLQKQYLLSQMFV